MIVIFKNGTVVKGLKRKPLFKVLLNKKINHRDVKSTVVVISKLKKKQIPAIDRDVFRSSGSC